MPRCVDLFRLRHHFLRLPIYQATFSSIQRNSILTYLLTYLCLPLLIQSPHRDSPDHDQDDDRSTLPRVQLLAASLPTTPTPIPNSRYPNTIRGPNNPNHNPATRSRVQLLAASRRRLHRHVVNQLARYDFLLAFTVM